MTERRLTANASTSYAPEPSSRQRSSLWPPRWPKSCRRTPDPKFKPYVASRYAACPSSLDSQAGHAADIAGRLPAAAQAALRGKELRAYCEDLFSHSEVGPPITRPTHCPADPPVECFEVSTEEAIVLFETLRRAGFAFGWLIGGPSDLTSSFRSPRSPAAPDTTLQPGSALDYCPEHRYLADKNDDYPGV
jgi:hypothetical protein